MLKIGDFSKLAQVSVKTLRYYGKLGLLKPAWVDRFTGYRYYTLGQLPRLNRILALKDLGFSLQQIQQLLRDDLSASELRGMMRMRHAELERRIQAEQTRLARVETRLRQIEQEGAMPDYEVVLKTVRPQRVAGIRAVIPAYRDVAELFEELRGYLRAQKVSVDAMCSGIAIYYDAEYRDRGIDAEAAAPLAKRLRDTPRAVVHELPGVETMACVVHQGSYDGLPNAYNSLMAWIEANGYRVAGPNRDVYLQGPERRLRAGLGPGPANCITEVQFPVTRKPVSIYMKLNKEREAMEPKIVTKSAYTVVGMLYRGKNENNEIAQMWGEFVPRIGEIKHRIGGQGSYGVCSDVEEEGVFEYVAGMPVDRAEDIPAGMVCWEVPEQTYAVFPCTLQTIGEAYKYAFESWLPGSGYQRASAPDFEHYDESFDPDVEGSQLYIYVPLKQR